jgi:dienelactone hydrolase
VGVGGAGRPPDDARAAGFALTASAWYFRAAAAVRFGLIAVGLTPERIREYSDLMLGDFAAGAALDERRAIEHLEIPWEDGRCSAWLIRPRGVQQPPVVVSVVGLGGRKEEGEAQSRFLTERGVAVLLVDLPGQGETLLRHGLVLDDGGEGAISACVGLLHDHEELGLAVGVWGTSLGGLLACRASAADRRLEAVCMSGAPFTPSAALERMGQPVAPFWGEPFGITDSDQIMDVYRSLDCGPELLGAIACPATVVHGARDMLATTAMTRAAFEQIGCPDKRLLEWEDGDHCVYNHFFERTCDVSDWLSATLYAALASEVSR